MDSEERKKPKQIRSLKMIEDILEGTKIGLEKIGFEKLTTSKISEITGISVGSFYQYFRNKDYVLLKLFKGLSSHILDKFIKSIKETEGMELNSRVDMLLEIYLDDFYKHKEFLYFMPKIIWTLGGTSFILKNRELVVQEVAKMFQGYTSKDESECYKFSFFVLSLINGTLHQTLEHQKAVLNKEELKQDLQKTIHYLVNDFLEYKSPHREKNQYSETTQKD